MITNALIVGFVVALAKFVDWWGSTQLARPIFIVALLGVLLGHPTEGVIMGAQLELIFLGNVSLGGVMPSDITLGSIFGAAFAMIVGSDLNVAIALAVPISMLGTLLYSVMKMVVTSLVPRFEKHIREHNYRAFSRLWHLQFWGFELCYFLLGFVVIVVGADAVKAFVDWLPAWVQTSMTVASTMLPAIGLALLLKMLWQKSLAPYYFLGFALGAFFFYQKAVEVKDGAITTQPSSILSLVQIAFVGFIIAAIVVMSELKANKQATKVAANASVANVEDESEDFFDD
ncbi:PTS sugar transporter subunit IIC [Enterococcus devriesei]|uniref:PTS mannose/fructose/sorbose/N-acetylgalactosamine transporter subunit IIC n=1 Tax=Enterococcus TaxID=1350 RepID=UPI001C1081FB|nr:PTS sugar transporter subunit IIC [Enterococcus devriesei]MBU5365815.1 PTS sugar transporter subunit IIC [Enterococcus devriesei]MDT2821966.1 PTS sugar transporter subunit IIC [Enterococcus devriesei]